MIPCLVVPEPILHLALQRRWSDLVVLARWCTPADLGLHRRHREGILLIHLPRPFDDWPPSAWQQRVQLQREDPEFINALAHVDPVDAEGLLSVLKRFGNVIARSVAGDDVKAGVSVEIQEHALALQVCGWGLAQCRGDFTSVRLRTGGFKYAVEAILACLRTCRLIRGGARTLLQVVTQAANIFLSKHHVEQLRLDQQLPSASLLRYYELQLDTAMMLVERERFAANPGRIRYGWTDSSPQMDYDWVRMTYAFDLSLGFVAAALNHQFFAIVSFAEAEDNPQRFCCPGRFPGRPKHCGLPLASASDVILKP